MTVLAVSAEVVARPISEGVRFLLELKRGATEERQKEMLANPDDLTNHELLEFKRRSEFLSVKQMISCLLDGRGYQQKSLGERRGVFVTHSLAPGD